MKKVSVLPKSVDYARRTNVHLPVGVKGVANPPAGWLVPAGKLVTLRLSRIESTGWRSLRNVASKFTVLGSRLTPPAPPVLVLIRPCKNPAKLVKRGEFSPGGMAVV